MWSALTDRGDKNRRHIPGRLMGYSSAYFPSNPAKDIYISNKSLRASAAQLHSRHITFNLRDRGPDITCQCPDESSCFTCNIIFGQRPQGADWTIFWVMLGCKADNHSVQDVSATLQCWTEAMMAEQHLECQCYAVLYIKHSVACFDDLVLYRAWEFKYHQRADGSNSEA